MAIQTDIPDILKNRSLSVLKVIGVLSKNKYAPKIHVLYIITESTKI